GFHSAGHGGSFHSAGHGGSFHHAANFHQGFHQNQAFNHLHNGTFRRDFDRRRFFPGFFGYGLDYYPDGYGFGSYPYGDNYNYSYNYYSGYPYSSDYAVIPAYSARPVPLDPNLSPEAPPPAKPEMIPPPRAEPSAGVQIDVWVPAHAEIWFDGDKTSRTGALRQFECPPLPPGQDFHYDVRAVWKENGKVIDQTRTLTVQAGDRLIVNFLKPQKQAEPVSGNRQKLSSETSLSPLALFSK